MTAHIYPWLQGHWQQLMRQRQQQCMPHAMLFRGFAGLGKTDLAASLAHAVLCQSPVENTNPSSGEFEGEACGICDSCRLIAAGTHPDLYRVKPLPPVASKSKNPVLSIRIDAVRELCHRLGHTSQMSGYRVAIIEQADMMNIAAANSLLKTLEEPGNNTLILLVSASPERLPVTIRSRCQSLNFFTPDYSQVEGWLMQQGTFSDSNACRQAFRLAHDAPLAAIATPEETEQRNLLGCALLSRFNNENVLDYSLKLSQGNKQQLLGWFLDWVNDLVYLSGINHPDVAESRLVHLAHREQLTLLAGGVNTKRLFELHAQVLQALQHGSIALNAQLLWENLLLSWDNL